MASQALQDEGECHGYRNLHSSIADLFIHPRRIRLLRRTLLT